MYKRQAYKCCTCKLLELCCCFIVYCSSQILTLLLARTQLFDTIHRILHLSNFGYVGSGTTLSIKSYIEKGIQILHNEWSGIFVFSSFFLLKGFGACCQHVVKEDGGVVTNNCTMVTNPEYPDPVNGTTPFGFTVENIADDICFIRLDFVRVETRDDYELLTVGTVNKGDCFDVISIQ